MVDLVHWYGNNFDPLLIARPAWWRATIWIAALFFGPFYVFAIYAYAKGKNWIRFASIVCASVMLTNVFIILFTCIIMGAVLPVIIYNLFIYKNFGWFLFTYKKKHGKAVGESKLQSSAAIAAL